MAPATRRRRLMIIFGSVFGLPVLVMLALFLVPAASFSPEALGYAVARESGGSMLFGTEPCRRHVKGGWSCWVEDGGNSGSVHYRVEMLGSRCWQARATHPRDARDAEGDMRIRFGGCLKLRDQLRVFDRLRG